MVISSAPELQGEARVRNTDMGVNTKLKQQSEVFAKGEGEAGGKDKHPLDQCFPIEM